MLKSSNKNTACFLPSHFYTGSGSGQRKVTGSDRLQFRNNLVPVPSPVLGPARRHVYTFVLTGTCPETGPASF